MMAVTDAPVSVSEMGVKAAPIAANSSGRIGRASGQSAHASRAVAKPSVVRAMIMNAACVPTARNARTFAPGAVKCSVARPGATIRRAIVALARRWTGDHARTPIRAVDKRDPAWAQVRGAGAASVAAAVDTKSVAAIDA